MGTSSVLTVAIAILLALAFIAWQVHHEHCSLERTRLEVTLQQAELDQKRAQAQAMVEKERVRLTQLQANIEEERKSAQTALYQAHKSQADTAQALAELLRASLRHEDARSDELLGKLDHLIKAIEALARAAPVSEDIVKLHGIRAARSVTPTQ
jgi:regulatory protein YycI of two-component signal transduction system YycFG